MRVVPLEAFRDRIPFAVAVNAVERGFRALGLGEATLPDPMVVELAEQQAEVHVKGAHLRGARHIVLKVATGFYRNRARGLWSPSCRCSDSPCGIARRSGPAPSPRSSRPSSPRASRPRSSPPSATTA